MANETNTLSQIDGIRKEINKKLSNAKINDAFNLIKKNIVLLNVSIDDVNLHKANYINSKKQFEQGIIDKDKFDKVFARTVRGIQSMLKIDDDIELIDNQNIQNQGVKKSQNRHFLWLLLPTIVIILLPFGYLYIKYVSNEIEKTKHIPSNATEKLTPKKLEEYFRQLNYPNTEREKKNQIIDKILYTDFKEKKVTVKIMGANDNLVDEEELSYFLKQLKYGNYKNTSVKSIGDSSIIIKHEN